MADEKRYVLPLLHVVFFLSGICTVLIGQVLPVLSASFALNDLQSGFFFPAQFTGSLFGTLLTNWFGKKNKFVAATIAGCWAMAAGVTAMNFVSFEGAMAGFFVNGLGVGLTLPAINMLILEMNPRRSAPALSVLNLCWGLGAIICKPFVDLTATESSIFVTSVFLAFPLLVGGALLFFLPRGPENETAPENAGDKASSQATIWATSFAWMIAFFNFVHVGFESGIGGWLTTYADRLHGGPVTGFLSPTFIYFLFFIIGRGTAPLLFRFMDENKVIFLDLGIMLAGMLLIISAGSLSWLLAGAAVSGFGTSSVFPTNVSRFTRTFGSGATRRATPLFICGTLGAAAVTWLIGFVSNQAGDLRAGMFALLACVIVLLVIQLILAMPATFRIGGDGRKISSGPRRDC